MSGVAFFLCAMTANALEITNVGGVMTLDYTKPGDANFNDYNNNADLRKATTKLVIIGSYTHNDVFRNPDDWGIQTLDFSQAILPDYYYFNKLYSLKEIIWPSVGTFRIPDQAFRCDTPKGTFENLTIPSNCTEVCSHAFDNSVLKNITITGPSTILRAESFRNIKTIKDVYVLEGEETYYENGQKKYYCEKTAFDFDCTWVQTQIDRVSEAACLHIPEKGNKDVFRIPGVDVLTQAVLCNTHHESSVNGWQEFIKNSDIIVDQKEIFRTFSDTKPHLFPQCNDINTGLKIYYVIGVVTVHGEEKILIEPLNEESDYVLPANTGALIYTKKGFVIYDVPESESAPKIGQYAARTPCDSINYLESLQDAPDNYYMSWTSTRRGKQCINMFLDNKRDIDLAPVEWGFYTIIPKNYSKEEISYRAYLNFPTSMIESTSMHGFFDGNGDVPPTICQDNGGKVFSLDYDEDDEIEATGIFKVVRKNTVNSDAYYNVAGQQISGPTKGLYIHNGKKFMK